MCDFKVRYDSKQNVVRVEMHGEFDAALLSKSTAALVEEIRLTNCEYVLLDHRNATPKLSIMEQYRRPEIAFKLGVPKTCRIAIVCREIDELYHFIETVGVNHGYFVKVFQDIDVAIQWLKN